MRYVGLYKPTFVYWGPVRGCKRCLYLPEATHLLKGGIYTAADGTPGLANAIQASLRNGVTVAPTTLTRIALVRIQVPQPIKTRRVFIPPNIAEWCNGSTYDSDSYCLGSNPSSAAKSLLSKQQAFLVRNVKALSRLEMTAGQV